MKNNTGMLWYFDKKTPLDEAIIQAAEFYRAKYGRSVGVAHANPKDLEAANHPKKVLDISVVSDKNTLTQHLWVGEAAK